MNTKTDVQRFKGDITAQDELSANTKGGSTAAILKKRIARAFGIADVAIKAGAVTKVASRRLAAATVDVDEANKLLLMATQDSTNSPKFHIRRTGAHRVEISIEGQEEEGGEIDDIAAAFVELKKKQFATRDLLLSKPMSADEFEATSNAALAEAEARHGGG